MFAVLAGYPRPEIATEPPALHVVADGLERTAKRRSRCIARKHPGNDQDRVPIAPRRYREQRRKPCREEAGLGDSAGKFGGS